MDLQHQYGPTCLLTSAAMVLDITVDSLLSDFENPFDLHVDELIDYFHGKDIALVRLGYNPQCEDDLGNIRTCYNTKQCETRMKFWLERYEGILIFEKHAVAWNKEMIYDPRGLIREFTDDDFTNLREFLAAIPIH